MSLSNGQQRWYDQNPDYSLSVSTLEKLPPAILIVVSDGIILMAEQQFQAHDMVSNFRNLGKDTVLALYKSKRKLRQNDQNPFLYSVINYVFVLSEANRQTMCRQMLQLFYCVFEYVKECNEARSEPGQEEVSKLTNVFISQGFEAAKAFLGTLRDQAMTRFEIGEEKPSPNLDLGYDKLRLKDSN